MNYNSNYVNKIIMSLIYIVLIVTIVFVVIFLKDSNESPSCDTFYEKMIIILEV